MWFTNLLPLEFLYILEKNGILDTILLTIQDVQVFIACFWHIQDTLQKDFGMKTGEMLWNYSRGIDNRHVGMIQVWQTT